MRILVYTFRTFPEIDKLREIFPDLFVFGKLKQDFADFTIRINTDRPDVILGIAKSQSKYTHVKARAVNKFSGGKKILANGQEEYQLWVPDKLPTEWKVCRGYGTTFCNWTMYRIADFVDSNKLPTREMFIHVVQSEVDAILGIFLPSSFPT